MQIESQKLRQVTLCIQQQDKIMVEVNQNEEKSLPSFKYNPNFDPWDNLAAARYLYEHTQGVKISNDNQYITMMTTDIYKELVEIFNQAQIISSSNNHKVFYIQEPQNLILPFTLQKLNDIEFGDQFTKDIIQLLGKSKNESFYALLDTWEPNSDRMRSIIEVKMRNGNPSKQKILRTHQYKVYLDQYPTEEELSQIKGFVISGSPYGVYENVKWFENFFTYLRKVSKHKLLLGSCFGHQSLAHALGGRVEQMATKIINYGPRYVRGKINLADQSFEQLIGFMCHGDEVIQVPPDIEPCFTSDYCSVQGLKGKNILSTQFHPEFNNIFIQFISKIMERNIDDENHQQLQSQKTLQNQDCYIWRKICKRFLKGKNEQN